MAFLRRRCPNDEIVGADIKTGQDITEVATRRTIAAWSPDVCVNLAGLSGEAACRARPELANYTNNLAAGALRAELPRSCLFVQASSASVLGRRGEYSTPYAQSKRDAELELLQWPRTLVLRFGTLCGVSPSMRWDLPAHRMIKDAVTTGVITLGRPNRKRPWLMLAQLLHALHSLIEQERGGMGIQDWTHPLPLCSYNATLGETAAQIMAITHARVEEPAVDDGDDRDYTLPVICPPRHRSLGWAEIAALARSTFTKEVT
jgi:nucleoside-diphosphate-sugar epimerase